MKQILIETTQAAVLSVLFFGPLFYYIFK